MDTTKLNTDFSETTYGKIYFAFSEGNWPLINELLSQHKEVEEKSVESMLHIAIQRKELPIFKLLLQYDIDVNKLYSSQTPLEYATALGLLDFIDPLLVYDTNAVNTAMIVAIENENLHIIQHLINRGADLNFTSKISVNRLLYDGYTPLHRAVNIGNIEIIKLLLKNGANVNFQVKQAVKRELSVDENRQIEYHSDDCYGRYENVHYVFRQNLTVLELAIQRNFLRSEEILDLLLKKGAAVDIESEQVFPLHLAVIKNSEMFVFQKLLQYGANINSVCEKNYTPLEHALVTNRINIALYLLKKGGTFNKNETNSLLHNFISGSYWREDCFALIMESGADINSKNQCGQTPLHREILHYSFFNVEKLHLLPDYGADVNLQDFEGNTPLHLAVKKGNEKNIEVLLEYGADLSILNRSGCSPFYILNQRKTASEDIIDYSRIFKRIKKHFDSFSHYFYENEFLYSIEKSTYVVIRAIILKEATGKQGNRQELDFIRRNLNIFYEAFHIELENMKLHQTKNNVSFYDILTESVIFLEKYMERGVIENIESSNFRKQFPLYSSALKLRLMKIKERKILLEFCRKRYKYIFRSINKPGITEKISSYMSSVDLINLWRVFKRPEEYLSKLLNRPQGMTKLASSN